MWSLWGFVSTSWADWSPSKYLWAINNVTGGVNSRCLFTKELISWFVVSHQPRCWPTAWLRPYQGCHGLSFLRVFQKPAVDLEISFHWKFPSWFPSVFRLNYSASDTNDRNRVKSRLKKFISRRPSLKTLQEKGLIKGVFSLLFFFLV